MALTEPLLSARHKMSYYNSGSDTAHLVAREKINMAAMPTDDEQTLSGRDTPGDDSLRKRSGASSFSSGAEADDSFIRIADNDPVAEALQQCETWVLRPYRFVLRILGWTQFTRDGDAAWQFILRMVLVAIWTLVLIMTSLTQILSCFPRDRFAPGNVVIINMSNTTAFSNSHMNDPYLNDSFDEAISNTSFDDPLTESQSEEILQEITCKDHVISSFVFFDLLLLFTYWFGLYLFSRGETEYLSNLAEKVFIKQATNKKSMASNWRMIATILAFFVVGLLWIAVSFAVRIMTARTVRLFESSTIIRWNEDTTFRDGGKLVLIIFSLLGFIGFDIVYVTAVMNYAAQSEMLVYLLRSVRGLVEQKAYEDVDKAIKDIMEIRNYLHVLNGKTAAATALILYNLGSAGVLAIITLDEISMLNSEFGQYFNQNLATVAAGLNVTLWMGLVCFPFIQAARVTDECGKLQETGSFIRMRPYQYCKTPQLELDSYVTFTQAVKLRATMFGIPIYPWMAYLFLVAFTFTMLVLFQTNVYSFSRYL